MEKRIEITKLIVEISKEELYLKMIRDNYINAWDSLQNPEYVLREYFGGESFGGG